VFRPSHDGARLFDTGPPAVVVTGANGQLGRAFVSRLVKDEACVRLFVARGSKSRSANRAIRRRWTARSLTATAVFHIGAAMGGGWEAYEATAAITGTRNIGEACL